MLPETTTVLLIEDEPNDLLFMQMAFEGAGVKCRLEVARDGREAMEYLKATQKPSSNPGRPVPYLILLDLKLPHVMGLEILDWLRSQREFDATIVLVLSSSADPSDVDSAYHRGASGYLVKPTSFDHLQTMVECLRDFWLVHNQPASRFLA